MWANKAINGNVMAQLRKILQGRQKEQTLDRLFFQKKRTEKKIIDSLKLKRQKMQETPDRELNDIFIKGNSLSNW